MLAMAMATRGFLDIRMHRAKKWFDRTELSGRFQAYCRGIKPGRRDRAMFFRMPLSITDVYG